MKLKIASIVTAGAIILGGGSTITAMAAGNDSSLDLQRVVSESEIETTTPKLNIKVADSQVTPIDVVAKGVKQEFERVQFTAKPKPKPKPKPKVEAKVESKQNQTVESKSKASENHSGKNKGQRSSKTTVAPSKIAKKSDTPIVMDSNTTGKSPKEYAKSVLASKGMGNNEYTCLVKLWNKESGWNHKAENPSSGAYGIPQSLPGSKMASKGADWKTNPETQINWGLSYISGRYGTPCNAWGHSQKKNWY